MTATCSSPEYKAPRTRSRVTNGRSLFVEGKQTSAWARRWRDVLFQFADDASAGAGMESLSEGKRALLRRISTLVVELERMECEWAQGKKPDLDLYSRASNTLHRLIVSINGLERVPRDVTPSLADILNAHSERTP